MTKLSRIHKKIALAALVTFVLSAGSVFADYTFMAGPKTDGTGVTPHGWVLTPPAIC